jgi:hypothetical protein
MTTMVVRQVVPVTEVNFPDNLVSNMLKDF